MPKPRTWDRHAIKAELHRRGMTMAALAKLAGSTPAIFGHVWTRPVRKAEQAIADYLGIPAEELFPDRYPIRNSRILSRANEQLLNGNGNQSQAARDAA